MVENKNKKVLELLIFKLLELFPLLMTSLFNLSEISILTARLYTQNEKLHLISVILNSTTFDSKNCRRCIYRPIRVLKKSFTFELK